jgi:hypothetical protein
MRSFCPVHLLDTILSVCYGVLSLTCWRVILKHRSAIISGNATGLTCYLICSCFFCIYRTISLWILIFIDASCSHSYGSDSYVDVLDLINSRVTKFRYAQFMLSSLALTFFYSSYAYFAYSLTKVLDMLTTSRREIRSAKANSHFLNVYIGILPFLTLFALSLINNPSFIWYRYHVFHVDCGDASMDRIFDTRRIYTICLYLCKNRSCDISPRDHRLFILLSLSRDHVYSTVSPS